MLRVRLLLKNIYFIYAENVVLNIEVNSIIQKVISNPQMAESVHKALKSRFTPGRSYSTQSNSDIAIRSMEMMRINVQDEFDREINAIVKKYIDVS